MSAAVANPLRLIDRLKIEVSSVLSGSLSPALISKVNEYVISNMYSQHLPDRVIDILKPFFGEDVSAWSDTVKPLGQGHDCGQVSLQMEGDTVCITIVTQKQIENSAILEVITTARKYKDKQLILADGSPSDNEFMNSAIDGMASQIAKFGTLVLRV